MKNRIFLITLGMAAMITMNVQAAAVLSPRAADNQPKIVPGYNSDPNLAATELQSAPPHVVESRSKTVPGKSNEVTPASICVRHMSGSPKMIGACAEHATANMDCCSTTVTKK